MTVKPQDRKQRKSQMMTFSQIFTVQMTPQAILKMI